MAKPRVPAFSSAEASLHEACPDIRLRAISAYHRASAVTAAAVRRARLTRREQTRMQTAVLESGS